MSLWIHQNGKVWIKIRKEHVLFQLVPMYLTYPGEDFFLSPLAQNKQLNRASAFLAASSRLLHESLLT